jgi:CheY-like chemotaxis protein
MRSSGPKRERARLAGRDHDCMKTFLIVDDEPAIRMSLSEALSEFGYSVRSVGDGNAAVTAIRKKVPDVVLSDLNMPGMSGLELLSVIRDSFPEIYRIAMSGASAAESMLPRIAAHAFYPKGHGIGLLLNIISSLPQREPISPNHSSGLTSI